jgi:hypothetical protein
VRWTHVAGSGARYSWIVCEARRTLVEIKACSRLFAAVFVCVRSVVFGSKMMVMMRA